MIKILFKVLLIIVILIVIGCSQKSIYQDSPGTHNSYPSKLKASGKAWPWTQRPYIISGKTYYPLPSAEGFEQSGVASWYGKKFHGRKTACGEIYNMYAKTAAHKTLPMNSYLLVKNLENNLETVVRINDRGPFAKNRIIDLSYTAARELDMVKNGTARVQIVTLGETVSYQKSGKNLQRFLPHKDFNQGEFFIQIGSFSNPGNARKLKSDMMAQGENVTIMTHEDGNALYYRVLVRAGNTLTAAKRHEKSLRKSGYQGIILAR